MPKKHKFRFVYIEWDDSYEIHGWGRVQDLLEESLSNPPTCTTIGFLMKETKDWMVICHTLLTGKGTVERMTGTLTIPRSCITKIKYLHYKKGK